MSRPKASILLQKPPGGRNGCALAGGREALRRRPLLSLMQCTAPPLGHDGGSLDAALIAAEAGLPVGFMTMAACLTTGPATLAGNLVVGNAEVIAALALIQLAYPGAPVFYAAAQTASDLRTGAYTGGGPEDFLFGAATNVLADFYNIPLSMGSFATGAKEPNWQAGLENSLSTFMACVVMSDMLLGVGFLHGSRIWSYEQMLMDCEIFSIIHKMMEGIAVDDETLALDTIQAVGPGGNFLSQKHTRRHMRELFLPHFMDRRPYNEWEEQKDDGRHWARESARQLRRRAPAASPGGWPRKRIKPDDPGAGGIAMQTTSPMLKLLTEEMVQQVLDEAFTLLHDHRNPGPVRQRPPVAGRKWSHAETGEVAHLPNGLVRDALVSCSTRVLSV